MTKKQLWNYTALTEADMQDTRILFAGMEPGDKRRLEISEWFVEVEMLPAGDYRVRRLFDGNVMVSHPANTYGDMQKIAKRLIAEIEEVTSC